MGSQVEAPFSDRSLVRHRFATSLPARLPMRQIPSLCRTAGLALLAWSLFSRASVPGPASPPALPLADTSMLDVVAARFLVDIDGLESGFPADQKAGGLLPGAIRVRENARLVRDAVATLRTPEGTPVKVALDSLFAIVASELRALHFHVLPADTLRGTVPYLLGHPMGNAQSVVSTEGVPRALEVEIDVTVSNQDTGSWAVLGTGRSATKGRPELYLRIRYADASGTSWREKVRVRSKERVELSERWLLGVRSERDGSDASSLFALTREAARRIVQKRLAALSADSDVH